MIFSFIKYIQPTHYFALKSGETYVFPLYETLPDKVKEALLPDYNYSTKLAQEYDLSWQALQSGYIGSAKTHKTFKALPVTDNYKFIRKYFHKAWSYYILILRLITFHNPIKELKGFYNSKNIKRKSDYNIDIEIESWNDFKSPLVAQNPLVSIVIPTLNRYEYLKDVLLDLEKQDYQNFEVIVIDQSNPFNEYFYKPFDLNLIVKHQEEKALWLARNTAIKISKGDYILLFDDDSRVEGNWVTNHLKCLDLFKADISSGVSISLIGAKVPENYSYFRRSDQLDTGNVLVKKQIFKTIGLFDRQFEKQRMGDGEFGLRAHIKGYLNISNPKAQRLHLKVGSGGLREMGSWDGFRPKKWFGARPVPSVLYYFRRYYGNKRSLLKLIRTVPPSIIPYKFKRHKIALILGCFISLIIAPVIVFQVIKSWYLANIKIKEGPIVENL